MKIQFLSSRPAAIDIAIIPLGNQQKNKRTKIAKQFDLDTKMLQADFQGNANELFKTYTKQGAKRMYLLGCGEKVDFKTIVEVFKKLFFQEGTYLKGNICIDFSFFSKKELVIEAAINGLLLGGYDVGLYKTNKTNKTKSWKLSIVSNLSKEKLKAASQKAIATAETQLRVMDLVNAPSNKLSPQEMGQWAIDSGKKNGFKVKVLQKKQIEKEGLHTVLAVNRGSELPPTFIVMEYKGTSKKKMPKIGLVGKGVTFDTGGISIKGHQNMHYMKCDMGGAAAVLGAMELTAKLQLPVHLVAAIPVTDNCVDANAVKPGDVIDSYLGKTIEIIDTDAEGRLILVDGIAYLNKNYQPDVLIDIATLTGSTVRTLGYHAGGLFSNNEQLIKQLSEAGQRTGERLWALPIWEEYLSEIRSDVADIKNFSGRPLAGAIVAAKFIEFFTEKHPCWAHLDIAGVAFGDSGLSREKSSTAYGVNLVVDFLSNFSK